MKILISVFLAFLVSSPLANSESYNTEWNSGDPVSYFWGCHTINGMKWTAEFWKSNPGLAIQHLLIHRDCFFMKDSIPAVLEEITGGPYTIPGHTMKWHIWKVYDFMREREYILVPDQRPPFGGGEGLEV